MAEKPGKSRGLGRGLSALMADVAAAADREAEAKTADRTVPIEALIPNPDQPRKTFDAAALTELTNSIRAKGVLQPLIVRPSPGSDGHFEIVAGERRWRAAQQAQLHELPVIVRDYSDTDVLEIAIIENVQRADLNPVEEALGYRQLIDRFGHTQEQVAHALGKSRSHLTNLLRLLQLPDAVLTQLRDGALTTGHARALISTPDPVALAARVVSEGLSVRQTEALARKTLEPSLGAPSKPTSSDEKDADTRALEQDLAAQVSLPVRISHDAKGGGGKVTITYKSLEDLDRLCAKFSGAS